MIFHPDKTNALKLYNRSIAVSPSNAVDLPIAYANKSAVLLEMKDYEACVGNINLALKHPLCPIWLVSALFERKIKCLLIMGVWNETTEKVTVLTDYCEVGKVSFRKMCIIFFYRNCSKALNGYLFQM